jgi:hypothetical protein
MRQSVSGEKHRPIAQEVDVAKGNVALILSSS